MDQKIPERAAMERALRTVLTAHGLLRPRYAVVLPVLYSAQGPELLIEVRGAGISQPSDPCFPGGKIEPGETPAAAASRELAEELGILASPECFLGQLPTVNTYLGSQTDLFVCILPGDAAEAARPNPAEVAELLRVPLSCFLEAPDAASYPVKGHTIWGMTAGAIRHFCRAWRAAEALLERQGLI